MVSHIVNKVVSIDQIQAHPRNYREHPESQITQLGASLARFSQYRSVVLWEQSSGEYITVAGHGIIEAMRRNHVQEVRADILDPSTPQSEIDAILVADNLHAQNAQDDEELLASLLQEQADAGYNLASLGTDDETLRQMLEGLGDAYLGDGGEQEEDTEVPHVKFKEYDESIEDDLDTEMCQQCGKLCLKSGEKKDA